jgi:predicted RNase H-like HicB family nuclease
MIITYTAKYTKIPSGYMGQLIEWTEIVTEGRTLEECREMLQDALHEMILAYQQLGNQIPIGGGLLEQIPVEVGHVSQHLFRWKEYNMRKNIPDSLFSTLTLLKSAYPFGIPSKAYLPLLRLLYEDMSDRNLAWVVGKLIGKADTQVLNDIYKAATLVEFKAPEVEHVRTVLAQHGYERWLKSDWDAFRFANNIKIPKNRSGLTSIFRFIFFAIVL